jgi:hypothetical protein
MRDDASSRSRTELSVHYPASMVRKKFPIWDNCIPGKKPQNNSIRLPPMNLEMIHRSHQYLCFEMIKPTLHLPLNFVYTSLTICGLN